MPPIALDPAHREPDPIPDHTHGISKYYYDLGCKHPLCVAKATAAKAIFRARRRSERVWNAGRWIHPELAPAGSSLSPRHGTAYARVTYGCQCEDCHPNRKPSTPSLSVLVCFPGHAHVTAALVVAAIVLWLLLGVIPTDWINIGGSRNG